MKNVIIALVLVLSTSAVMAGKLKIGNVTIEDNRTCIQVTDTYSTC